MNVSIVIPAYNEEASIERVIEEVERLDFQKEIIVVDDGSRDRTAVLAARYASVRMIRHQENRGRGAAVRTGFEHATGDIVCIQDADMEQLPSDIPALIAPIASGRASVVFGCRIPPGPRPFGMSFVHLMANRAFSIVGGLLCRQRLHDVYTGSKCYRSDVFAGLKLRSSGFEQEMEVVAKCGRKGIRIAEVPIHYSYRTTGRSSMRLTDGLKGLAALLKYSLEREDSAS